LICIKYKPQSLVHISDYKSDALTGQQLADTEMRHWKICRKFNFIKNHPIV